MTHMSRVSQWYIQFYFFKRKSQIFKMAQTIFVSMLYVLWVEPPSPKLAPEMHL